MAEELQPHDIEKKPLTIWGVFFRGALMCLTLFVIVVSCLALWYVTQRQHYLQELAETTDRIHAAGGPLEAEEIEAYYRIPEGEEDLTDEYLKALRIFRAQRTLSQDETALLKYVGSWEKPLVGKDWDHRQLSTDYLEPFQPSLDQFRDLGQRRGSVRYPVKMADNVAALLPDAQALRDAARHLCLDFDLHLLAGDRQRALADLQAIFRAGETLREEPIVISLLVRLAIFGMFLDRTQEFLAEGKASEEELQTLAKLVPEADFRRGLQRVLNGERAMAYLAMKTHSLGDLDQIAGGGNSSSSIPVRGSLLDLRPGDAAVLLRMQSELIEAAELDFPEMLDELKRQGDDHLAQLEAETLPWNKNLLAALLLPAVGSMGQATARGIAQQDALRVAIAIEHFHLKTGKRPAGLTELVPDYLPAVPRDPFNGQPLSYVLDESSYAVYSAGKDRLDDKGMIDDKQTDVGVRIRTQAAAEDGEAK